MVNAHLPTLEEAMAQSREWGVLVSSVYLELSRWIQKGFTLMSFCKKIASADFFFLTSLPVLFFFNSILPASSIFFHVFEIIPILLCLYCVTFISHANRVCR